MSCDRGAASGWGSLRSGGHWERRATEDGRGKGAIGDKAGARLGRGSKGRA